MRICRRLPALFGILCMLPVLAGAISAAASQPQGHARASSPAITMCLRQGYRYNGTDDTDIDSYEPYANHSADEFLRVKSNNARNFLIRFLLPTLPAEPNTTIGQAILRLHVGYRDHAYPMRVGLYRIRRRWTALNATWFEADAGIPWDLPGCNNVDTDRYPYASAWADAAGVDEWLEFDITNDVVEWLANPDANYGYIARGEGTWTVEYQMHSSDSRQVYYRPELCITYYEATPTPTITLTPTPTATPTPTPTVTPTPTRSTGNIVGLVWHDGDGNGRRDPGEPPLAGALVALRTPAGQLITYQETAGDGYYHLSGIAPGLYWLQETDPAGFVSTTVNDWMVYIWANQELEIHFGDRPAPTPTPTSTATLTPIPTATFTPAPERGEIHGLVWYDVNGNGRREPEEPPLAGAQIVLRSPAGQLLIYYLTGHDGTYRLEHIVPGQYWLQEIDPPGYVSVTVNDWMVYVPAGGNLEIHFGDRRVPTPTPTSTPTATPTMTPTETVSACRDEYEPDDEPLRAKSILTDGTAQIRNFHRAGDVDYVRFIAFASRSYVIRTSNLGGGSHNDTVLLLLAPDGVSILAGNDTDPDNPPASRIEWTCPSTDAYFILVTQRDPTVGSCDITYELSIRGVALLPTPTATATMTVSSRTPSNVLPLIVQT